MAVPPGATEVVPGETLTLKSGATTLSVAVAECTREPLVPVIEMVELLAGLPAAVETVRVEVPDPLTEDGEKDRRHESMRILQITQQAQNTGQQVTPGDQDDQQSERNLE